MTSRRGSARIWWAVRCSLWGGSGSWTRSRLRAAHGSVWFFLLSLVGGCRWRGRPGARAGLGRSTSVAEAPVVGAHGQTGDVPRFVQAVEVGPEPLGDLLGAVALLARLGLVGAGFCVGVLTVFVWHTSTLELHVGIDPRVNTKDVSGRTPPPSSSPPAAATGSASPRDGPGPTSSPTRSTGSTASRTLADQPPRPSRQPEPPHRRSGTRRPPDATTGPSTCPSPEKTTPHKHRAPAAHQRGLMKDRG